jgi:hypothetical protein
MTSEIPWPPRPTRLLRPPHRSNKIFGWSVGALPRCAVGYHGVSRGAPGHVRMKEYYNSTEELYIRPVCRFDRPQHGAPWALRHEPAALQPPDRASSLRAHLFS